MLTQRTNILFDKQTWTTLQMIAKEEKTSVGKLVRAAIQKTYFEGREQEARAKAVKDIRAMRPHLKGKINYKHLIAYGRKY